MNKQQPSSIFALNFLQEMKGDSRMITGAYDPEQQLWIPEGQVKAGFPDYTWKDSWRYIRTGRGTTGDYRTVPDVDTD